MNIQLHENARTTPAIPPAIRLEIQAQPEIGTLLLPLDDLLAVTHEFIHPAVSRSGLDRCLRRHEISTLKALMPQEEGAKTPVKIFKAYAAGFVHVDAGPGVTPLPVRCH